jgi:DNA-directed RNA polymerase specialized sigma24 family protein
MSISEIAIVLGTSRGSVKNTLSSALKKLSKIERLKKLYEP